MIYSNLETYLTALERELQSLTTSERAEILLEIKSHVMSKMEEDSSADEMSILKSLGSPRDVAIKYVDDRGIEWKAPVQSSGAIASIVKWLVIGFLGTIGVFVCVFIFLVTQFSPLVEVDEEKGKVKILGGMIDIDDFDRQDFNISFNDNKSGRVQETYLVENLRKPLLISAASGKMNIRNSSSGVIEVNCKAQSNLAENMLNEESETYVLDLSVIGSSKCEIDIPGSMVLSVKMNSGILKLDKLVNSQNIDMNSGRIKIKEKPGQKYKYTFNILTGKIDDFETSSAKDAIPVSIKLRAGRVQRD